MWISHVILMEIGNDGIKSMNKFDWVLDFLFAFLFFFSLYFRLLLVEENFFLCSWFSWYELSIFTVIYSWLCVVVAGCVNLILFNFVCIIMRTFYFLWKIELPFYWGRLNGRLFAIVNWVWCSGEDCDKSDLIYFFKKKVN